MHDVPQGFRIYTRIIERLEAVRPQGGGITARCPVAVNHKHGDRNPSLRLWIGDRGELVARCMSCQADWRVISGEIGVQTGGWFPDGGRKIMSEQQAKSVPVAEYPYRDKDGNLQAVKVRWEPGWEGRSKSFSWRREIPADIRAKIGVPQGVSAWVQSLNNGWYKPHRQTNAAWYFNSCSEADEAKLFEMPFTLGPGLYRLPELLKANPKEPVFVVEGEKVVHTLVSLGFIATTGNAGMGKWDFAWSQHLAGRRVVIIPDRDPRDAAMEYAYKIAGSCVRPGVAASVRIIELPIRELKPDMQGGDLAHWLAFGGKAQWKPEEKRAAIISICKNVTEWEPKRAAA